MRQRFIERINTEIRVYDADTTLKELIYEMLINFIYSFAANISVPFIALKYDLGVLLSFVGYYYLLSYILNRDKYETKFGRYILLPIPCIIGAFCSYKCGYFLVELIK